MLSDTFSRIVVVSCIVSMCIEHKVLYWRGLYRVDVSVHVSLVSFHFSFQVRSPSRATGRDFGHLYQLCIAMYCVYRSILKNGAIRALGSPGRGGVAVSEMMLCCITLYRFVLAGCTDTSVSQCIDVYRCVSLRGKKVTLAGEISDAIPDQG